MVKDLIKTIVFGATVGAVLFLLEDHNSIQREKSRKEWDKAYRRGQLMGEYSVYSNLERHAASPCDVVHEVDRHLVCPYGDETEVTRFHFRVDEVK